MTMGREEGDDDDDDSSEGVRRLEFLRLWILGLGMRPEIMGV